MMFKWLALRDSNPRLADYEPAVLTAELRAGKLRGHVGTGTWGTRAGARGHAGTVTRGHGEDTGGEWPGKWSSEGESNPHRPVRSREFCPLNYLTLKMVRRAGLEPAARWF